MQSIKLFIIAILLSHATMGFAADVLAGIERLKSLSSPKLSYSELIKAAKEGDSTTVKQLLARGTDTNARGAADSEDVYGPEGRTTALLQASIHGHTEIVKILLSQGANPDLQGIATGSTALMAATNQGHKDIVKLLLDHGANPNIKDVWNSTALDLAKKNGNKAIIALIEAATK